MFGKKKPEGPPSEDELRERIENAIDEGTGFIALRKGMIAAGSDVKVVDRIIAEILHERSGSADTGADPFLKHGASIAHTHTNSEDEHEPYTEKHQAMADTIASQHVQAAPSKVVSNLIFVLTFVGAIAGSVYAFMLYGPQKEAACEDGGPTSLICAELLLDRYYQAQGEYPDRLELLVPRYAVLPLRTQETSEPYYYMMHADGSGYRLCPSEASADEFCSIRSIRAPNTSGTSTTQIE